MVAGCFNLKKLSVIDTILPGRLRHDDVLNSMMGLRVTRGLNSLEIANQIIHRWPVMGSGAAVLIPVRALFIKHKVTAQFPHPAASEVMQAPPGQEIGVGSPVPGQSS